MVNKKKNNKSFWNQNLADLKHERETLRKKAEETKNQDAVQRWRRSTAITKRAIIEAKRNSFSNFISKIDYKRDSKKTYNYMNKIENNITSPKKGPILFGNTTLHSDKEIANAFANHYSQSQQKSRYIITHDREIRKELQNLIKDMSISTDISADRIFNEDFTTCELSTIINGLKTKKSPGPDHVFAEFIQHLGPKARISLLHL